MTKRQALPLLLGGIAAPLCYGASACAKTDPSPAVFDMEAVRSYAAHDDIAPDIQNIAWPWIKARGGGIIRLPRGLSPCRSPVVIPDIEAAPLIIEGHGPVASQLGQFADAYCFDFGDPARKRSQEQAPILRNFGTLAGLPPASQNHALFRYRNCNYPHLISMRLRGGIAIAEFGDAQTRDSVIEPHLTDVNFSGGKAGVPVLGLRSGSAGVMEACNLNGGGPGYAVANMAGDVHNWDGFTIRDTAISQFQVHVLSAGAGVGNLQVLGGNWDRASEGAFVIDHQTGGSVTRNWQIVGVNVEGPGGTARPTENAWPIMVINPGRGRVDAITVTDCLFMGLGGTGVDVMTGARNVRLLDNTFKSVAGASGAVAVIRFRDGTSGDVTGARGYIDPDGGPMASFPRGVLFEGAPATDLRTGAPGQRTRSNNSWQGAALPDAG